MSRPRRTTKSLAVPNLSWPDPPRTFSLWSKTRKNMPRPVAGGLLNSKTANLPMRRCSKPAFPATNLSKPVTSSSPDTHPDYGKVSPHATDDFSYARILATACPSPGTTSPDATRGTNHEAFDFLSQRTDRWAVNFLPGVWSESRPDDSLAARFAVF